MIPPLCPHCQKPMQLAESIRQGDILVSERYLCYCTTQLFQKNIHYGDKTRQENE